jgi:hypothetical protein
VARKLARMQINRMDLRNRILRVRLRANGGSVARTVPGLLAWFRFRVLPANAGTYNHRRS